MKNNTPETLPINAVEITEYQEPTLEEIALAAYYRWIERGRPHGSDQEDWFVAKQQLTGETLVIDDVSTEKLLVRTAS